MFTNHTRKYQSCRSIPLCKSYLMKLCKIRNSVFSRANKTHMKTVISILLIAVISNIKSYLYQLQHSKDIVRMKLLLDWKILTREYWNYLKLVNQNETNNKPSPSARVVFTFLIDVNKESDSVKHSF